jgi:hypothetical protein
VPQRKRGTPWALIVGVVVLAVLAAVLLVILVTRDTDDGTASGSTTPSPSVIPSASPSSTASASAGAGSTPAPSAAPGLAVDQIVATTVEGLSVREAPGLDAERLGSLESGALSFVVDGPSEADGHRWYLVSALGLPPNSGCAGPFETDPFNCPSWFGWVAAASEAGDTWLAQHEIECPDEPVTIESLALGRTPIELLACFGPSPITLRGWWPEIPDDAGLGGACTAQDEPSGWLLCQNINYNRIVVDEEEGFSGSGFQVSINPASGLSMPERGTWVEVRVHLDDPAAQDCDEAAASFEDPDRDPEQYVLDCRTFFVLEDVTVVDGP